MPQTISVTDVIIPPYILSVTTRLTEGDEPKHLEELTFRTIGAWLYIVNELIGKENYVFKGGSVEERYADELNKIIDNDAPKTEPFEFDTPFGDSRVTVWDTWRSSKRVSFHLNSDDNPQVAIDTWRAQQIAVQRALDKYNPNHAQIAPQSPQTHSTAPTAPATSQAPASPTAFIDGVLMATRAPNANRVDYANGQHVGFTVNKIVASSNKGSATYQFWTALGSQYPTVTVYKLKPDGTVKPDFENIAGTIAALGLSLDKPQVVGNWRLVCKVSHVPSKDGGDKEYLNVVSLTAI